MPKYRAVIAERVTMYRVVEVEADDIDEAAEAAETGYGEDTDGDYTGPENFETWVVEVEEASD